MSGEVVLVSIAVVAGGYLAFVLGLVLAGRRAEARAVAGFVPDCVVLFRRLVGDERVARSRKLVLLGVLGYLVLPVDLVPDFLPVVGQLDDAIVVAIGLRFVLRGGGPALLAEHWPGPPSGQRLVARLAGW